MTKNSKKKKTDDLVPMDTHESSSSAGLAEAMDTSEAGVHKLAIGAFERIKRGRPMKRSKNVRKKKAMAKAMALTEKYAEKVSRNESKAKKIEYAKKLYD